MFGQHDDGSAVDQTLLASLLQVGCQFAMQALDTLIIGGEQFRLNAEQITALTGLSFVDHEFYPQVGQVVSHRTLLSPEAVADKRSREYEAKSNSEKCTHK